MKTKFTVALTAVLAVCSTAFSAEEKPLDGSRPNIILMMADDLGYGDTGFNGNTLIKTPHLDQMAQDGVKLTHFYAGNSVCSPTRGTCLTGRHHHRYGIWGANKVHLPKQEITLARMLKEQGYATGHFGKWHVSGFDKQGSGNRGGVSPAMQGFADVDEHPAGALRSLFAKDREDPKHMFAYTRRAMKFAERCVSEDKPFLIYLAHHAVHAVDQSRPATLKRYKAKEPGKFHKSVSPGYGAMMADLDASIGLMMEKLKELGVEKDTVVIFLSDNGGTPEHAPQTPLRCWKGSYYEGGIRVPFLVRWPDKIKPSVNNTPVMAIDLYPTMLELAGVKDIEAHLDGYEIDGESLVPTLLDKGDLGERALFWHFPAYLNGNPKYTETRSYPAYRQQPVSVIRRGDWKLLMYLEEWSLDGGRESIATNNALELYNLRRDVSESKNLAPVETEVRDQLLNELLAWQKAIGAPVPKEANVQPKADDEQEGKGRKGQKEKKKRLDRF